MKSDREIMVVDRATLFADEYFQGFAPAGEINYAQIIEDNYFYEKRSDVETKPEYKQPIAYCLIINDQTRQAFAYQRSSTEGEYDEKRLRGKWSWGIGGHIDRCDTEGEDPILTSLMREIDEEIHVTDFDPPEILGYINDDNTHVGQVHFGILFLLRTRARIVRPKDSEISWGGFMSLEQLEEIASSPEASIESWSEISLDPMRKVLSPPKE